MSAWGMFSIVVVDEIGQVLGRLYVTPTDEQQERARAGQVWRVVREVLDDDEQGAAA